MSADDGRLLLRQLCDDLRLLRLRAGGPSLRSLAARLRLGKSQVGSILNGKIGQLPDWDVVRGIVDACRQYAQDHDRLDQLSQATGIEQVWRPRYTMVDYVLQQAPRQRSAPTAADPVTTARRDAPRTAVPRQLPAATRHFAGRAAQLAELDGLLDDASTTNAVVISAIEGTAGVGKTALAMYWAHRVTDRFPDGQLYVNLRGFGPSSPSMAPAEAIRRFLDALGVPAQRIPPDPDAQAALYRSELAGRRMLILLDNARDSPQVRPLLPGTAGCLVLVTSRDPLTSLVAANDAHPVTLDLLTHDEARDLLVRRLGGARVAAEPDAVDEVITRCARLPLALAIVVARAATGRIALGELAEQLRDHGRRPYLLNIGDPTTDLHVVFAWSYQTLTPPAARMFRLLSRHPGPDTTAPAMASLCALPLAEVRPLLAELTRANLLAEPVPGRYTCHDLLRAYATHLSDSVDAASDRRAATTRVLDHYLHTANAADRLLHHNRDPVTLAPAQPGTEPEHFADRDQALDWLTAQHPVLLAVVDDAAATGHDHHTWQLAWILTGFLERNQRWSDQVTVAGAAVAAARRLTDPRATALAHRILARAHIETGRYNDARADLERARDFATRTGDLVGQAHTHHHLGYFWERQGQYRQALDHSRQALTLYQAAGHLQGQAAALNAVGCYQTQLGDHPGALASCQDALTLLRKLNHRSGQAATWDSLAEAHHHLGNHARAVTCYRESIALFRDLGERHPEARILTRLGDHHQAAGDPRAARAAWQQALTILTEINHPDAEQVRTKLARNRVPGRAHAKPTAYGQTTHGARRSQQR